jgi:hypothetical protein
MNYVRRVDPKALLAHASIDTAKAPGFSGPLRAGAFWHVVTPVNALDCELIDSKLVKSIKSDVDDANKRSSLLMICRSLQDAIFVQDYQGFLKDTPVTVKSAYSFKLNSSMHKVWEFKYGNKDRMYFFTLQQYLIVLMFCHKKDQNTPDHVKKYCEKAMRPFLMPKAPVQIIEDKS